MKVPVTSADKSPKLNFFSPYESLVNFVLGDFLSLDRFLKKVDDSVS